MAKNEKKGIAEVKFEKKIQFKTGEIKGNNLPRFENPNPTIKRPPKDSQ